MGLDGAEVLWRKSSASGSGDCVEVAFTDDVAVRDSRDSAGIFLEFTECAWVSFIAGLKDFEAMSSRAP
jgi:hypothetical protein